MPNTTKPAPYFYAFSEVRMNVYEPIRLVGHYHLSRHALSEWFNC